MIDVLANQHPVNQAEFKKGMSQLAGGVALISTGQSRSRRGMIVTSVCSLSVEPPALLVCISKHAELHAIIMASGSFVVNLLSLEHRKLAQRFSGKDGIKGAARFLEGDWGVAVTGAPVLNDAVAFFDCKLRSAFDAGTHTIFSGLVLANAVREISNPLIYCRGGYSRVAALN